MAGFDFPELCVSFIVSAIGFVYFHYGRKQARINLIVSGLALMVFPYLVSDLWTEVMVGILIACVPFTVWR